MQGAIEKFHQTLKNMMQMHCLKQNKDWDGAIFYCLLYGSLYMKDRVLALLS